MIKKTLLISAVLTIISLNAFAQNVNIPDANFKAYLVGNSSINTNSDSEIQVSEANNFTGTINCQSLNISDLTGIEAFTALTKLLCGNNPLGIIDVSQNTALTLFQPHNNNLTTLDVTQNTALTNLVCVNNNLSSLDVSQNTNLQLLSCLGNNLSSLDFTNNTNLSILNCANNNISSLDMSNSTGLTTLMCDSNNLTSLNMKNLSTSTLTTFNATNNPNLTCIQVDDVATATSTWTNIDNGASFSLDCNYMGVNDIELAQSIFLYPNPTNTVLSINSDKNIESIVIVDVMGKTVKTMLPINNSIDVSNLPKGIYFLQAHTDQDLVSKKFIKE